MQWKSTLCIEISHRYLQNQHICLALFVFHLFFNVRLKPHCMHRISVVVRCAVENLPEPDWQRLKPFGSGGSGGISPG